MTNVKGGTSESERLNLTVSSTAALTVTNSSLAARGLRESRESEEAEQCSRRGFELHRLRRFDEALAYFERLAHLQPNTWLAIDDLLVEGTKDQGDPVSNDEPWTCDCLVQADTLSIGGVEFSKDGYILAKDLELPGEQMRLGYLCSTTGRPDYSQAAFWYREAAKRDYGSAQYNLGLLYRDGDGVPQDYLEAYFWLELAVSGGINDAEGIACRNEVASHLDPTQLLHAQERISRWMDDKRIDLGGGFVRKP